MLITWQEVPLYPWGHLQISTSKAGLSVLLGPDVSSVTSLIKVAFVQGVMVARTKIASTLDNTFEFLNHKKY